MHSWALYGGPTLTPLTLDCTKLLLNGVFSLCNAFLASLITFSPEKLFTQSANHSFHLSVVLLVICTATSPCSQSGTQQHQSNSFSSLNGHSISWCWSTSSQKYTTIHLINSISKPLFVSCKPPQTHNIVSAQVKVM